MNRREFLSTAGAVAATFSLPKTALSKVTLANNYKFVTTDYSPLEVWRHPERGEKFTIGVDAATGVGQDWTVANVLSNRIPFEQVGHYRAKNSVVEAAKDIVELGWYFNGAMLVIETNYPGNAIQDAAVLTYRYPYNYQAEEHLDSDPNVSDKFGIKTTESSKWLLIRGLQQVLKDDELILNCPRTIDEILNFVYKEDKSKTGASEGMNDDEVISLMLAVRGCRMYPQAPRPQKKKSLSVEAAQQRRMMRGFVEKVRTRLRRGETIQVL